MLYLPRRVRIGLRWIRVPAFARNNHPPSQTLLPLISNIFKMKGTGFDWLASKIWESPTNCNLLGRAKLGM